MTISKERLKDTIEWWTKKTMEDILKVEKENESKWEWIDIIYNTYNGRIGALYVIGFISIELTEELTNNMLKLAQKQKFGEKAGE